MGGSVGDLYVKFNKWGVLNFKISVNLILVMNEKRDINV